MELKIEKSVSQKLGLLQLRYQSMLQEFTDQPKELQNGFFQYDGVTAHTKQMTLNFSREFYDNCLISYQTDHSLPTFITRFDTFGLFRVPDVEKHHLQNLCISSTTYKPEFEKSVNKLHQKFLTEYSRISNEELMCL
ncbi:hypothetical protein Zmor_021054 [Zophobas morio]|uniref:Uncharacterized protein n=1 Tax=Zophobas morio TaxID=2755281 RepID=A0AA38I249_9CUCU|nr:hypothetical protein Zmor_021054 [Zophobas morio]